MFSRHRQFEKWLHLYREGELTHGQTRSLERHLAGCANCRAQHAALVQMERAVAEARAASLPLPHSALLTQSVLHRLVDATPVPDFWSRLSAPGIRLAAAAVLVLIMSGYLMEEGRDQQRLAALAQRNRHSRVLFARGGPAVSDRLDRVKTIVEQSIVRQYPGAASIGRLLAQDARHPYRLSLSRRARYRAAYSRMRQSGVLR